MSANPQGFRTVGRILRDPLLLAVLVTCPAGFGRIRGGPGHTARRQLRDVKECTSAVRDPIAGWHSGTFSGQLITCLDGRGWTASNARQVLGDGTHALEEQARRWW